MKGTRSGTRVYTSGAPQQRQSDNEQLVQVTSATKKTLWVAKTYGAKMRKTNMTVFRCVIQLRREKRVFTVVGGSALDWLCCGQTVSKAFTAIKKKQLNTV